MSDSSYNLAILVLITGANLLISIALLKGQKSVEINPCTLHGMSDYRAVIIDNKRNTVTYQCGVEQ